MRFVKGCAALLAVLLLAQGCSQKNRDLFRAETPESTTSTVRSDTEPAAEAAPVAQSNPCTLLTDVEVGAALGQPVAPPLTAETRLAAPGSSTRRARLCDFRLAAGPPQAGLRVRLLATGGAAVFDQLSKVSALTPSSGLGDGAFWEEAAKTLWLRVGDRLVTIQAVLSAPRDLRPSLEGLARLALGRI